MSQRITESVVEDAVLGVEAGLWAAADKTRGRMDGIEYKHVCLGPIAQPQALHVEMDQAVVAVYGWSDLKSL
jgi:hypothetical protein